MGIECRFCGEDGTQEFLDDTVAACPNCGQRGYWYNAPGKTRCTKCNGLGARYITDYSHVTVKCDKCSGNGYIRKKPYAKPTLTKYTKYTKVPSMLPLMYDVEDENYDDGPPEASLPYALAWIAVGVVALLLIAGYAMTWAFLP